VAKKIRLARAILQVWEEPNISRKICVVYDSKYGNTKRVAKAIVEGLTEEGKVEAFASYAKDIDPKALISYDTLFFGAPNHIGKPSRTIVKFIDAFAELKPNTEYAAAFDTYFQRQRNCMKATSKLEKHLSEKFPNLKLMPGLSIKVKGINGPIAEGELPNAKEFGRKAAMFLTTQP